MGGLEEGSQKVESSRSKINEYLVCSVHYEHSEQRCMDVWKVLRE